MKTSERGLSLPFLSLLSLGLLAATFAMARIRPIYWEDVWWHLGTGEFIVTHGVIPMSDVFSWTAQGTPWINTEWLYEVVLYGLFRLLGLAGVTLLKTVLILTALYFLDCRLRVWKAATIERLLVLGVVFLGGWPFWVELADLSSLAFLSALLFELDRADSKSLGNRRALLWVFLFTLWPNIHGAFFIGLGVIGLNAIFRLPHDPASARRMAAWTACCGAATLANPRGIGLPIGIFRNLSGNLEQVPAWLPPTGLGYLFFFVSVGLAVISFTFKKSWTWSDGCAFFIVLLFGGYALRHERFIHFFMVGAFPYAAQQWLKSGWRSRLRKRLRVWEKPVLILASVFLLGTSVTAARSMRGGISALDSGYIKEACDFIESEKIEGPFYNEYKFGSYWIWRFKGNPPVFQDGRHATVLGYGPVIDAALEARRSPESWGVFMDERGVHAALVRYPAVSHEIRPAVLDRYFPRQTWGLVYWDDQCLLFIRRTPRYAQLLRQWEYRVIKPDWTLETFQDQIRRRLLDRRAAREEFERNLAQNPGCRRARIGLYWLERS